MDVLGTLAIRFHFKGEFIRSGRQNNYYGGREAMSYISRDRVSLSELIAALREHCKVKEGTILHWLFPGKDLDSGLHVLLDDKVCQYMSDCIVEVGVAEIYAEEPIVIDISEEEMLAVIMNLRWQKKVVMKTLKK